MLEAMPGAPRPTPGRGWQLAILLLHAFAIWAACAATIAVGRALTSMETTLVVHALAAPVIAATVSTAYFRRHRYTSPLVTAAVVLGFVVAVDFFLVALVINGSLEMFRSVLGTWLPFLLIFAATAVSGALVRSADQGRSRSGS